MPLHKIRVEKIPSFLLNIFTVHHFWLLPVNVSRSISLTCSLRCIIPVYCIHHSLDKHNFERKIVNNF